MKVERFAPSASLAPLVRAFTFVESTSEATRTLIPEPEIIIGFRYGGSATLLENGSARLLPGAAFTGLRSSARRIRTSAKGSMVLAMFHGTGAAHFFAEPLHEMFGSTLDLEDLMPRSDIDRIRSRIALAETHAERVLLFEQFLLARRRDLTPDPLVASALDAIRRSRGCIRVGALAEQLEIGPDRLEKRFRARVGASPKQVASIVRIRHAIASHRAGKSLAELAVEAGYFDQSHFNREFRAVTGQSPKVFFGAGDHCWSREAR